MLWTNCLSQEDIQIYYRLFFEQERGFCFDCKKTLLKMKYSILTQIYARYEKNIRKQNCLFHKDLQTFSMQVRL